MSDDLPIPSHPSKGSDLPPPPPELIENKISTDGSEESFEDIKNSIDNILSEVSEFLPPGLDTQPLPLPPSLDMHCLLYTSPSPRDRGSRMPSSA